MIRHRVTDFGKEIELDGTFYEEDLNGLFSSIVKFILLNQKDPLFETFTKEIREISEKEQKNDNIIICNTKDITLNPSSQLHIRGRQEMDQTGRKYCPWTKKEEKKLMDLNSDFGGDIYKLMKYFPDRSPESIKMKIKRMNVK